MGRTASLQGEKRTYRKASSNRREEACNCIFLPNPPPLKIGKQQLSISRVAKHFIKGRLNKFEHLNPIDRVLV